MVSAIYPAVCAAARSQVEWNSWIYAAGRMEMLGYPMVGVGGIVLVVSKKLRSSDWNIGDLQRATRGVEGKERQRAG